MTHKDFTSMVATDRSIIVPFRTRGAGSPLFCFPGAGGNVHIFDEMTAALPEGQPVYAIDMEPLCDLKEEFTIEQLAPFYLEVVRTVQERGPYYFCGYSIGGLLAYEMACRLIDEGDSAELVAVLDAGNPAMVANLSQEDALHFHKTYLTNRLSRYRDHLLQGNIKAFAARGLAFIAGRLQRFVTPAIKSAFHLAKRPLPKAFRASDPGFQKAWHSFVPKRYAKDLVLFKVHGRGPEFDRDPSMGWDACVAGSVQVHIVPGGHVDMMNMPSVRTVAERLASYLHTGSTVLKTAD